MIGLRTIIAGSRSCTDFQELLTAVRQCGWVPITIISGTALGADRLGEQLAYEYNIPLEKYPANWDLHGKSAGYKRNTQMAEVAEALIALWDGESRGTKHMIDIANRKGLKVYVYTTKGEKRV